MSEPPRSLNPPGWPRPQGYSNGVVASGRQVYVAGQIGWDETGTLASGGLVPQVRQALANCLAVVAEAGGGPEHVTRMTWFVADRADYAAQRGPIGAVYRELMGSAYPAMSLFEVGLLEPGALIEIEVTAVVPG
jgi:enamine deaminase RidA (YjgF/YER057c/UK114 family)